jgi:hypothetical protein
MDDKTITEKSFSRILKAGILTTGKTISPNRPDTE